MNGGRLIEGTPVRWLGGPEAEIRSIVADSREVSPGTLFVARRGRRTDGRSHIPDAVDRGAVGVLSDAPAEAPRGVMLLRCESDLDPAAAALADRLHEHPGRSLTLIGVTGTNGKTTTTHMIRHLLGEGGVRCGLIGTVEVDTGDGAREAGLTTPDALTTIALLRRMVETGCAACVMEVSSHALDQGRTDPLPFDVAAFTNLSGDHLDYHGDMDAYAAAKARLFERLGADATAIVNADDEVAGRMVRDCGASVLRFAVEGAEAECRARIDRAAAGFSDCKFAGPWGEFEARLPLGGRHNAANMLAALGAAHAAVQHSSVAQPPSAGPPRADRAQPEAAEPHPIRSDALKRAIETCPPIPGRLEPVRPSEVELPFEVLVDYAHTDDALANVLRALRPVTAGRLWVVFGCGGDRDETKRPRMAKAASELADELVVTSDNPRTEDPGRIIEQILTGLPENRESVAVEPDRQAAIERAVGGAGPGDAVLIAGKGHEDYQIVGEQTHPFDDRCVAAEAMRRVGRPSRDRVQPA